MTSADGAALWGGERLQGLPLGSVVYVTDYSSIADRLWAEGTPAVSGLGRWGRAQSQALAGHHAVLLTDCDTTLGRTFQVARSLSHNRAASVKVAPACPALDPEGAPGGLDDFIKARGVAELLRWALEAPGLEPPATNGRAHPDLLAEIFTAAELQHMEIPEPNWVIRDLLPEGLCLMAGRPKIGKSWLALQAALAVANPEGRLLGRAVSNSGPVLYIALEDYKGRLKGRISRLQEQLAWPGRLHFQTADPQAHGTQGVQLIEAWCQRVAGQGSPARMVVVDTLERFRKAPGQGKSVYHEDLEALMPLQALAQRWHIVVMVLDHLRKAEAQDIFDRISGSAAKTGTADSALIVERNRVQRLGKLTVTGRDIEERELALDFDPSRCLWTVLDGDAAQHLAPPLQRRIVRAMQPEGTPFSPAEIMLATGLNRDRLKFQLGQMERAGLISRWSRGKWVLGEAEDLLGDTPTTTTTTTTTLTTPHTPPTVAPHPPHAPPTTQAPHTPHAEGEERGFGEFGEYRYREIEVCPGCGQLWPGSNSKACPDCGHPGPPTTTSPDPSP
ncbi:MAG: AAA family ATPase [Candidatus Dormibacteria bacterium]